jgi:glycosyltransferase involved in cell wall biosynthesis
MRFSILTPTHNPRWIGRLEASLKAQTAQDYEWVVVPNAGIRTADLSLSIPQARAVDYSSDEPTPAIGALKHFAADQARGDILVEVDHDDELTPDCLDELARAFDDPAVDFAFSNCCEIKPDGTPYTYSPVFGWKYRPFTWAGRPQQEIIAFDPTPASFSRIWYAPNHVRAWRRSFYEAIGGHDRSLHVLDDQDLLCRTYAAGNVKHVDRCLYVYHYHGANTCKGERNREIQVKTLEIHTKYIERLCLKWCSLKALRSVDLCSGPNPPTAYEGADLCNGIDLDGPWPWPDGSVGLFRAQDALEHLRDPIHTMTEANRCLAPGGWMLTNTPSTDGRGAFQDPTHRSYWNPNSFHYYTRAAQAKYIGTPAKFQAVRVYTHYPSQWHRAQQIPYVAAHLLKPMHRTPGRLEV